MSRTYVTVAIPYVNAEPHLGYAYELVQADVYARSRRLAGDDVRFLGGTDDHALKNVLAAEAAGVPTDTFVDSNAQRFAALAAPLAVSFDDFLRTSADPRHRPAVERLWRACAANGDLYQRSYEGEYCLGCERYYDRSELVAGSGSELCCPEHRTPVERIAETNWFFRLSRYEDHLSQLITSGELAIHPQPFRDEVLSFLAGGLEDISVSRPATEPAAGVFRCPTTRPRSSTCGSTPSPTISVRSSSATRKALPTDAGGCRPTAVCTSSARESCVSTPCTGRRFSPRPTSRRRPASKFIRT